jgi:hypothetical protein
MDKVYSVISFNSVYLCTNIKFNNGGMNVPNKMEVIMDTSSYPDDEKEFEYCLEEGLSDTMSSVTGCTVISFDYKKIV